MLAGSAGLAGGCCSSYSPSRSPASRSARQRRQPPRAVAILLQSKTFFCKADDILKHKSRQINYSSLILYFLSTEITGDYCGKQEKQYCEGIKKPVSLSKKRDAAAASPSNDPKKEKSPAYAAAFFNP